MQTNAVIVRSNMSIETILSCIPTTEKVREEVGAYSKGGDAFLTLWKREQALIRGRALIRAWSLSRGYTVFIICNLYSEQTSSYLKYLMNSCIWHSEPSILRLLHYIVTLLIAKILHNYEFELEFLILALLSYSGVSNMVSWRTLF